MRQAQGVPKPKPTRGDGMQAARPHGLALVWRLLPWEVYSALRMVGVRDGPPIITSAFRLVDHGRAVLEFGAHLKGSGWHQLGRARARERSEPCAANPLVRSTCMPDHSAHMLACGMPLASLFLH